jgi:hypothetical protein
MLAMHDDPYQVENGLAYDPVLDLPVITGTSDNFSSHWYGRRAQSRLVQWSR